MVPYRMDRYVTLVTGTVQKPMWASGPQALRWQTVMGTELDELMTLFREARAVRFPTQTPSDVLYLLASERGLEKVPGETEAAWRLRIKDAWRIWHRGGTQEAHRTSFGWYGLLNVGVYRRKEWSTPRPAGSNYVRAFARAVWSQFDVVVRQPHPWTEKLWGSPPAWGTGTWGSSMTTEELRYFRRQGREFKAGHDTFTYLHVVFGNGRIWGPLRWGDGGLWGGSARTMSLVIGEAHWETRQLM